MRPVTPAGISRIMSQRRPNLPSRSPVSASKVAERLRAHERLCRQIAQETWNETIAGELIRLADQCLEAADNIELDGRARAALH